MAIHCELCDSPVDKTEKTDGFGAMTIIKKKYTFGVRKIKNQELAKKDFDICSECCEKLLEFIEEIQKTIAK